MNKAKTLTFRALDWPFSVCGCVNLLPNSDII